MAELLDTLETFQDSDGRIVSELFQVLPSRSELPIYYTTVSRPISLDMMRRRLREHRYLTVDQLAEDVNLMYLNAQNFNEVFGSTRFAVFFLTFRVM